MATIKGVWRLKYGASTNDKVLGTSADNYEESINFTSNGESFTKFKVMYTVGNVYAKFINGDYEVWAFYAGTMLTYGFYYATVDFGYTEQTVSDAFYSWFEPNYEFVSESAEPEDSQYSIKASTLTAIADSIRAKTGGSDPILTEDIFPIPSRLPFSSKINRLFRDFPL